MKTIELFSSECMGGLCEELRDQLKVHQITEFLTWIELEFTTDEAVAIKLNQGSNDVLHFMYNSSETITLASRSSEQEQELSEFQSAIIHDKKGNDTYLKFKPKKDYKICIAQLAKENKSGHSNPLFLSFKKVFQNMSDDEYIIHTGIANLELGEYVKELLDMKKESLSDKLMAAGYINIILSIKLKQYINFINNPVQISLLSNTEIQRIKEITEKIITNPENNYNIDDICKKMGLNAGKLQQGFKEMHGKTVCNFINHIRLEKAEELLKSSDLNVSQIVYALGWTSRSYFCKIFKQKYQCTPKSYQALILNYVA